MVRPASSYSTWRRRLFGLAALAALPSLSQPKAGAASAEVAFEKEFLGSVLEALPPRPFQKQGRHRGSLHDFRLVAIDPVTRQFRVSCQVDGEYRPPIAAAIAGARNRGEKDDAGWRTFRFDLKLSLGIEPGPRGVPRVHARVDEIKRRELEGLAGTLALVLGSQFDDLATKIAEGRAEKLGAKLNADLEKRLAVFQQFGALAGVDYAADRVVLRFAAARSGPEPAGYVLTEPVPGAVPLYLWVHPRLGTALYAMSPVVPSREGYRRDRVAGYVFPSPQPGTVALFRWRGPRGFLFTIAPDGAGATARGYRPAGVAGHLYPSPRPGTAPIRASPVTPSGPHAPA